MWIHERKDWTRFTWDVETPAFKLADMRHRQGRLLGRMEGLGFELKREATLRTLTSDVVKSSAIEGENLDPKEVRSSIARRLGIDVADPVLRAGLAHFWFVTVHPFEDGNGRVARAIADMALARADGTSDRFYSLSSQLESERKDYYGQLERRQRGTPDVTGWLEWFLDCFGRAVDGADVALNSVLFKARLWEKINREPVNKRQRLGHRPHAGRRLQRSHEHIEIRQDGQMLDGHGLVGYSGTEGARHPYPESQSGTKHELSSDGNGFGITIRNHVK